MRQKTPEILLLPHPADGPGGTGANLLLAVKAMVDFGCIKGKIGSAALAVEKIWEIGRGYRIHLNMVVLIRQCQYVRIVVVRKAYIG